jgi:sugar transferase (PEP-CTERM/EpsH1 system associated)
MSSTSHASGVADAQPPLDAPPDDARPLIVHVIYRLQVGGLENGVVNLINHLPEDRYRHALVCLSDYTDFRLRIARDDVPVVAMHKKPGQDFAMWRNLYRLFRRWKPAVVHTRNIGCLEAQIPAWLARVPGRVHGEHGWDVHDKDGSNVTYRRLRRLHAPLVHRFIALSGHLDDYLRNRAGIAPRKIERIYNGVDLQRFRPGDADALPPGFAGADDIVIGTVGRMHGVKDQTNLAHAFVQLCHDMPHKAPRLRLVMIGDGPLHAPCLELLERAGLADQCWLPGARDDIPDILRSMQIFALPSQAEGISNTILEAMASGLPGVATDVGGNPELVVAGQTGALPPANDALALANALRGYVEQPALIAEHGRAGLQRVQQQFSLQAMMDRYAAVYDSLNGAN